MTHAITDHGELDFLTPKPSEVDKAIARFAREAIEAQRKQRNAQDRDRKEQAKARALYEQAERDYLTHNRNLDGQS